MKSMKKLTKWQKRVIIGGVVLGGYYICKKLKETKDNSECTVVIDRKAWFRRDYLCVYTETTKSGWSVPDGAYNVQSEQRFKRFADVEFGSTVSCQYPIYDNYYRYSFKDWEITETFTSSGSGPSSEARSFKHDIAGLMPPDKTIPEIGDRKFTTFNDYYYIYGIDQTTGERVKIEVDPTIYDSIDTNNGPATVAFSVKMFSSPYNCGGLVTYNRANYQNFRVVQ